MEEEEKYIKAGKIASKAREKSREIISKSTTYLEAAEKIEAYIEKEGGKPAFPVNLSVNNEAAHYTPNQESKREFKNDQVIKIDIGVHVDGYVGGDTAYTLDLTGENEDIVKASEEALQNALSMVKVGVETREIGKEIRETIESKGYKPVRNLTGHGLGRWKTHMPPTIPNIEIDKKEKLDEGQIIAIEPFASTGKGMVKRGTYEEIYAYERKIGTRNRVARKILEHIEKEYKTLPFAKRWISKDFNQLKFNFALNQLIQQDSLISYPVLKDVAGSIVSQAEQTVIVEKDGCKVITE